MADVFDIDSRTNTDPYNHREIESYRWSQSESVRKDPRLNRHDNRINTSLERSATTQLYDKLGVPISPVRKRYSRSPSPRRNSRSHHRRSSERSSPSPTRRSKDGDSWKSPQRLQKQMYSQPMQQTYQPQAPPPPIYQPHEVRPFILKGHLFSIFY